MGYFLGGLRVGFFNIGRIHCYVSLIVFVLMQLYIEQHDET